jgi:hypothetical protein
MNVGFCSAIGQAFNCSPLLTTDWKKTGKAREQNSHIGTGGILKANLDGKHDWFSGPRAIRFLP